MTAINHESGFTAFEVVLTVVALLAVGVAGYFAFQARQNANHTTTISVNSPNHRVATTTPKATTAAPAISSTQPYLSVPQLGIKLPLSSSILDLNYVMQSGTVANFSTATLSKMDSGCQATQTFGPIGSISESSSYPMIGGGPYDSDKVAHVGSKYFAYVHEQSTCSDNDATDNLETSQSDALLAALKQAEAL